MGDQPHPAWFRRCLRFQFCFPPIVRLPICLKRQKTLLMMSSGAYMSRGPNQPRRNKLCLPLRTDGQNDPDSHEPVQICFSSCPPPFLPNFCNGFSIRWIPSDCQEVFLLFSWSLLKDRLLFLIPASVLILEGALWEILMLLSLQKGRFFEPMEHKPLFFTKRQKRLLLIYWQSEKNMVILSKIEYLAKPVKTGDAKLKGLRPHGHDSQLQQTHWHFLMHSVFVLCPVNLQAFRLRVLCSHKRWLLSGTAHITTYKRNRV